MMNQIQVFKYNIKNIVVKYIKRRKIRKNRKLKSARYLVFQVYIYINRYRYKIGEIIIWDIRIEYNINRGIDEQQQDKYNNKNLKRIIN